MEAEKCSNCDRKSAMILDGLPYCVRCYAELESGRLRKKQ